MALKDELLDEETAFDFSLSPISADITETVLIELVDACNGACTTCVRGVRYMKNRRGQMDFSLFEKITDKVSRLGFHWVSLFNWSDPFLCKDLYKYTARVKEKGMLCQLSSNLSYRSIPDLIPALANTDELIVSVSGFYQDTYKVNHRSGNIDFVKSNLKQIAEAKKAGLINTNVCLYYFNFPHSIKEWPLFKQFALDIDIKPVLWRGMGNPYLTREEFIKTQNTNFSSNFTKELNVFSGTSGNLSLPDYEICYSASYPTIIDCYGDVFLCPKIANTETTKIGNFLNDDFDVLQYLRISHPLCTQCKQKAPIQISPVHMAALTRGMIKKYGYKIHDIPSIQEDAQKAVELRGREVIFWGCGEMYKRKCHIFIESIPKCIISDLQDHPESVNGLKVLHPEKILPVSHPVPIVIFSGKDQGLAIKKKIESQYPQYKDIYICTEDINLWPRKLRENR